MPKFKVIARIATYIETEIEAEDSVKAWEIAQGLDGGEFTELPNCGDWCIDDVWEIENEG